MEIKQVTVKYCTHCGEQLKSGSKFCTQCGTAAKEDQKTETVQEANDVAKTRKASSPGPLKITLGIIVLILILFVAKSLLNPSSPEDGTFSELTAIKNIEGTWYDPSGALLGDKAAVIVLSKKGSAVVGSDANNKLAIILTPVSLNTYSGEVNLMGVDGYFDVSYYEDEAKLVFFSTLTKTSWNIKKLNK
jgi:hypothetical protein